MTLKKMSVAANDIVLNNLVMREKTFKTIPDQLCSVLLNLQFYPTQLGKTPAWVFKSSPRLLCEPTSLPLLFLITWKFHVSPLFFPGYLEGIQFSLTCSGVSHPLCCCLRVQPSPECSGQGRKIPSVPDVGDFYLSLAAATVSHQLHSRERNWRQIPAALDMDRQDISPNLCLYNTRSRSGFEGHLWLFYEASTSQSAGFVPSSPFPPLIQSPNAEQQLQQQICRILWIFTVLLGRQLPHGSNISIFFPFYSFFPTRKKRERGRVTPWAEADTLFDAGRSAGSPFPKGVPRGSLEESPDHSPAPAAPLGETICPVPASLQDKVSVG